MSHNTNDLEKKMANITIGSLSNYLSNHDYSGISHVLIQSRPEQLKGNIKEILNTMKTDSDIYNILSAITDSLKSDLTNWKSPESIKSIFNEIEDIYYCLISAGKPDKSTHQKYNNILEEVFTKYLNDVDKKLQEFITEQKENTYIYDLSVILLNFTQLLDVKNYEPILYPMAKFGETLFRKYNQINKLQLLIVEFILHINHRLVNYLAVVPGNPISKGLKESIFIYSTIRNNIVTLNYNHPEIITKALSILEHRSRFFGLTADAIPENENHGDYIVVDPLNTAFEDDDVYDDYERFLANLPN